MRHRLRTSERPGRPAFDPQRDVRAQLLNAATHLFAEHGVAATTIAHIAKSAGFTPAMVHYYFKDRDQLTDAVIEERLVPFISYVWDPVRPGDGPATMLGGVVQRLISGIEGAPWIPSTWMREILNEGGLLRTKALRRIPLDKVRMVGEAIRAGQATHSANSDVDPLLTVFSALGLVMLHMATAPVFAEIFHRPPLATEALRRHITGLLLDGLCHHPRPSSSQFPNRQRLRRKP
ncbi:MAG TPA: TetR/AcrR family transcriptional regulator [Candidatus Eisenbacteria bacterium]|nr:TetR/AcrR family transcriptional regulator [Candidatus Eisenbacteria bacterium]